VGKLSGGERARLALALITRDAPHMLILDEPTNHLDVDSREALVQALNAYEGAVVIVSHDRHMIELTADRLVLVDSGEANEFSGSLDDYTELILRGADKTGGAGGKGSAPKRDKKEERRLAAAAREAQKDARKTLATAEAEMAKLTARRSEIDSAMFDPSTAKGDDAKRSMSELSRMRDETQKAIEAAEAKWIAASELAAE
jgi:ATP-binding cassette, subfamily F, member 3